MDSQWSKQEACFAYETQMWLTVNYNTSFTSGEWIPSSQHIAPASELASCQSNLCHSWGYEGLKKKKSKGSLKACFQNANISSLSTLIHDLMINDIYMLQK